MVEHGSNKVVADNLPYEPQGLVYVHFLPFISFLRIKSTMLSERVICLNGYLVVFFSFRFR